jgi:hypothetical protein
LAARVCRSSKQSEAIADLLTRAGVETENIETRGAKIDKVIVSQITRQRVIRMLID